jgi:predicted permease
MRRLFGTAHRPRADADLEEELRLHLDLAAEEQRRRGQAPPDASRASAIRAGGISQAMDALRDQRSLPSLDALISDVVFGWRQLLRHRAASVSAILSLGLAIGAAMAAFRLVDAVLLRPLPVADPGSLFAITTTYLDADQNPDDRDDFDYPTYRRYVDAAGQHADLMLVGSASPQPIRIDRGEREIATRQFVSGNFFRVLGLQPVRGRLLSESDDVTPGGHPIVVISHDFWMRRFGGDPAIAGRTYRAGNQTIEIVGVAPPRFTGTEPGIVTDLFQPSMMNPEALNSPGWSWFRVWVRPKPGVTADQALAVLQSRFHADRVERLKTFPPGAPQSRIDAYMSERLFLRPAGAGVSTMQKSFRRPLRILAGLAALLLLIACANVANLLLARAMARRTEMALRLSIGAGRGRLIQLVLVESALLAVLATAAGTLFAAWAAPFVVSMLAPEERPVRLMLDPDWRTFGSGTGLTIAVTLLFGLIPALRASSVRPIAALKDERSQRGQRVTGMLIASQMALCVFLLFGASLFVGTFQRLLQKPLGFSPADIVHIVADSPTRLTPEVWKQVGSELRALPRVESVAVAGWAPLTGNRWRSSISVTGRVPPANAPNWVGVAPGYFETMGMRLIDGRDFVPADRAPARAGGRITAGTGIVNEAFARVYFDGRNPVGQQVTVDSLSAPIEIVGLVNNAVYFSVREAPHPAVFVPLEARENATFLVKTSAGAADLGRLLARELSRLRPDLRTRGSERFEAFIEQQLIRERLLAALSTFFATLALLLAAIGVYGVLNYAVTRERRDIGLRMALGARPRHVLTLVTTRLAGVIAAGACVGLVGGLGFARWVRTLLFQTDPADPAVVISTLLWLMGTAAVASLPPAIRAIGLDPAQTIKNED